MKRQTNAETAAEIAEILNKHNVKIPIECLLDIAEYCDDEAFQARWFDS